VEKPIKEVHMKNFRLNIFVCAIVALIAAPFLAHAGFVSKDTVRAKKTTSPDTTTPPAIESQTVEQIGAGLTPGAHVTPHGEAVEPCIKLVESRDISGLDVSRDGTKMVFRNSGKVIYYDVDLRHEHQIEDGWKPRISDDGKRVLYTSSEFLYTGAQPVRINNLKLWNSEKKEEILTAPISSKFGSLFYDIEEYGRFIITQTESGEIYRWDAPFWDNSVKAYDSSSVTFLYQSPPMIADEAGNILVVHSKTDTFGYGLFLVDHNGNETEIISGEPYDIDRSKNNLVYLKKTVLTPKVFYYNASALEPKEQEIGSGYMPSVNGDYAAYSRNVTEEGPPELMVVNLKTITPVPKNIMKEFNYYQDNPFRSISDAHVSEDGTRVFFEGCYGTDETSHICGIRVCVLPQGWLEQRDTPKVPFNNSTR
jgi:hypothetical protein